jgi:hypothetical protein
MQSSSYDSAVGDSQEHSNGIMGKTSGSISGTRGSGFSSCSESISSGASGVSPKGQSGHGGTSGGSSSISTSSESLKENDMGSKGKIPPSHGMGSAQGVPDLPDNTNSTRKPSGSFLDESSTTIPDLETYRGSGNRQMLDTVTLAIAVFFAVGAMNFVSG